MIKMFNFNMTKSTELIIHFLLFQHIPAKIYRTFKQKKIYKIEYLVTLTVQIC